MERSNHIDVFILNKGKQVASRKHLMLEGLFKKLMPKVTFGICRRKHCNLDGKVVNSGEQVIDQQIVRYEWNTIPWRKLEKFVFKLQKRIYQASMYNNVVKMRNLQKLLLKSTSAKLLVSVQRYGKDKK